MPNETNKAYILLLMDESRNNRQEWIKGEKSDYQPSLTDILNKYPRFKDFNGELVGYNCLNSKYINCLIIFKLLYMFLK